MIRGGPALNETVKGSVANVEFAPDFLAKSRQIVSLELINLNMSAASGKLLEKLATSKLNKLSLSNGLLSEFPMNALKIKSLRTLCVRQGGGAAGCKGGASLTNGCRFARLLAVQGAELQQHRRAQRQHEVDDPRAPVRLALRVNA